METAKTHASALFFKSARLYNGQNCMGIQVVFSGLRGYGFTIGCRRGYHFTIACVLAESFL